MAQSFFRVQTDAEKQDFTLVGRKSPIQQFQKKVAEIEQGYNRRRIPFCRNCAYFDFNDQLEKMTTEMKRTKKPINVDDLKTDFKQYAGLQHYDVYGTPSEVVVNRTTKGGMHHSYLDGYNVDFSCKKRGVTNKLYCCCVEVKVDVWDSWKKMMKLEKQEGFDMSKSVEHKDALNLTPDEFKE